MMQALEWQTPFLEKRPNGDSCVFGCAKRLPSAEVKVLEGGDRVIAVRRSEDKLRAPFAPHADIKAFSQRPQISMCPAPNLGPGSA